MKNLNNKQNTPFDFKLVGGIIIITSSISAWYFFVGHTFIISIFMITLILVLITISVIIDVSRTNEKINFKQGIIIYYRYLTRTIFSLLITFSTFPLIAILFITGPALILLFFVSFISCIMLFLIHVIGYIPENIQTENIDKYAIFFIISFVSSLAGFYFLYFFKGGFIKWLTDHYIKNVIAFLNKIRPYV